MNIGFIGLGKLGLPCVGASIESRGHNVIGYDPSQQVKDIIDTKKLQYQEIWTQDYLDKTKIKIKSIEDVVKHSEIILCLFKHHMVKNMRVLQGYLIQEMILITLI